MFLTTVRWRYADGLFLFKNTLKTVQMINIGTEDVTASEDIYDWYFVKWIFDENRTYYEKAEAREIDLSECFKKVFEIIEEQK